MEMQKFDRIKKTVCIFMLVFCVMSVTITGCLSLQSSVKNKFTDIAYATKSKTQKLDIYLPNEGKGPFPTIISFHGGGFYEGNKSRQYTAPMLQGLNHGYAVVTVDYRLSDEAKFPAAINDAKAAIRFIKVNAAQYNLNPNKIALWGSSAGGNLAALAGTTGGTNNCYDTSLGNAKVLDNVTAVVDWYGPTNFCVMDKQFTESGIGEKVQGVHIYNVEGSFPSRYLGQNISKVPDLCKQADPTTYITSKCPPFLIQHGTLDFIVPTQQSIDLAAAITKEIGSNKVTLILLDGAGHGGIPVTLLNGKRYCGYPFGTTENMDKVFSFLDEYMK
jgi:acetyl esterase/lipase